MTKFTKGPWVKGVRNCNEIMTSFPGVFIGQVFVDTPTANDNADASLMAAAPDLYDALSLVDRKLKLESLFTGAEINQILSALAKARGE